MLKLDKFKKIAEDDKTVTMRHDDGHEMKIIVKSLPHIQREQLKRLKLADGGKVQKMADGTPDDTVQPDQSGSQSVNPDHSTTININASPSQPASAATPVPTPAPPSVATDPTQIPMGPVQTFPASPPIAPTANAEHPNVAATVPAQALRMQQQAGNEQQAIDTAKSQANVDLAQQAQENAIAAQKRIDAAVIENKQHADDMAKIINDPKNNNPQAFYENMNVPRKIATSIGLLFGGLAGKGQGNIVMDYLKDQQDKDIAAQRQRSSNATTVWGAYNNLYNNENAATEMSRKTWNDKLAGQANEIAAQLGTPQAAQINHMLQGKLMNDGYQHLQNAAYLTGGSRSSTPIGGTSGATGSGALDGASSIEPSGGPGGKPKYGPGSADDTGVYNIQPILKNNAAAILSDQARRAAAGDPDAAAQLPRLQDQYAKAQKADEVISRARDIFSSLKRNATPGGWTARLAEHTSLEGVPVVGSALNAIGQFAGDAITGVRQGMGVQDKVDPGNEFSKNRQYETSRQELGDLLRSVFPGIGGGEYNSKLNAITPDREDSQDDVKKKMRAFEDLIKTSGEFNVLKNKGLTN